MTFLLFIYLFILLFRVTPVAYGCSQAKGWIGATAAGLHHNTGSETHLQPTPQLMAMQPDPLSKVRDQPKSSWILVRFISTAPQWEHPMMTFLKTQSIWVLNCLSSWSIYSSINNYTPVFYVVWLSPPTRSCMKSMSTSSLTWFLAILSPSTSLPGFSRTQ